MEEAFGNLPLDPGRPDHNVLQRVRGMIPVSPLTFFASRWIGSHQDDFKSAKHLNRWGKLNAECDRIAKSFWSTNSSAQTWSSANLKFKLKNGQFGLQKRSCPQWIRKSFAHLPFLNALKRAGIANQV
jgi:hypothetical protein